MNSKNIIAFRIVIVVILLAIMLTAALVVLKRADQAKMNIPVLGEIQPFEFVNQDDQPFGLDQLKGKITVVDFFFSRCHGPCPIMSDYMGQLYEMYKDQPEIQFVSISVEPSHDSLEVLKSYAAEYKVTDNRWNFLRGDIDSVSYLCENSFMLAADELPGAHSIKFVLLDKQARIRGYFNGTEALSIESLKKNINQLAKEEN